MTAAEVSGPYYDDGTITLYHADCLEQRAWLDADVLITDPPYGMAFRSNMGGAFGDCAIDGDDDTGIRDAVLELWGDKPALVFGRWSVERPPATRMVLTWEKGLSVGMGDLSLPWKPNTEEIYVLGSGFTGYRGSSVLHVEAVAGIDSQRLHPTEKPVALMRALIEKCPVEWTIADPFCGSGPTLRAAKDLGRRAIGVEKNAGAGYVASAARRCAQEVLDLGI